MVMNTCVMCKRPTPWPNRYCQDCLNVLKMEDQHEARAELAEREERRMEAAKRRMRRD